MGLFDIFKKNRTNNNDSPASPPPQPDNTPDTSIYSGMRVEVTSHDGELLFVAKLAGLEKNSAELRQFSESSLAEEDEGPLPVRIRGYHDTEKIAVYMEGLISSLRPGVWRVENLVVTNTGNERAFFRLDTNQNATTSPFGPHSKETPCRLLNISVGGAFIRSEVKFQMGEKFWLKVRLLEDREPSALFCKILRIIENPNGGPNEYGCQFLELDDAEQDRITENIFAIQRKKRGGRV